MGVSVDTGGKGGKKSVNADLNLVPYIDLLTCMVSFLLITAVWSQLARLEGHQKGQGQAGGATPPEKQLKRVAPLSVSLSRTGEKMWTSLPAYCCSHLMVPLRMLSPPAAGAAVPPAVVPPAAGAVVPPAVVPPAAGAAVPPLELFLLSPQAATRRPTRQRALKAPFRDFIYFPLRNGCTS